jgi:predicted DNA-binding transcriptional regulator AlpA
VSKLRIIRLEDLPTVKGITLSRTKLWLMIRDGQFPLPVKIGNRVGWPEHELDSWIKARMRDSRSKQQRRNSDGTIVYPDTVLAGSR